MAYEDDRDMELNRQLYEEDPAYEADTYFGERLGESPDTEADLEEYEDDATDQEATFGESLAPDAVVEEEDTVLTESTDTDVDNDESLLDKAKDKIDDWTDRNH